MPRPTLNQVITAIESDENIGFCLDCGEEHYQIEPDARRYKCEACGENRVYGAEEILVMGTCDEDTAGEKFAAEHFKIVNVGEHGTTVSTLPIVKTRKPPRKPRIPSVSHLLTGKEQTPGLKITAPEVLASTGIVNHSGVMLIRIQKPARAVQVSDGAKLRVRQIERVWNEPHDDSEELGDGDLVTINEKQCRRMIGKKTREHITTVNELYRRTAEKHGNVYRWFRSVAIGDKETGTPNSIIGFNTAGERVAIIACVIDAE